MEFTRLSIPSHSVAAGDLKRLIVERKRLDRQNDDFDLLLSDANTGKGGSPGQRALCAAGAASFA